MWKRAAAKVLQQELANRSNLQVLLTDLKACSRTQNLEWGRKVHAEAVECGLDFDIFVASALASMYAKCGSMLEAHQVFDSINHPDVVSWNVLILGYAENGQGLTALELFRTMKQKGLVPEPLTFVAALKACSSLVVKGWSSVECRRRGKQLHTLILENGCGSDICVQSTLIDMYSRCGSMVDARQVFDSMKNPDVVSWTAVILGYADNGQGLRALDLFTKMSTDGPAANSVTFVAGLKACTSLAAKGGASGMVECRERGKELHDLAVHSGCGSNTYILNTLIDMYAKCGSMEYSREVFDSMKKPAVVSWTALILGYAENGQGLTALNLFRRMKKEGLAPDSVTYMAALKACGLIGALEFGRTVHSDMNRLNARDVVLVTCLVDFYAKCGSLEEARSVFDANAKTRNVVTWTTLMAGYSNCGDHECVFGVFEEMRDAGFLPNAATFQCILTCCNHAGLVKKGKQCFDAMSTKYGIAPSIEHYTCMLDIFGRANKLDDAMALVERMPCSPDDVIWRIVLGACRKWKNLDVARLAFQSLVSFSDKDGAAYVLMAQIYRSRGMLREQETLMVMRKKVTAWRKLGETCWTNELGEVHSFVAHGTEAVAAAT